MEAPGGWSDQWEALGLVFPFTLLNADESGVTLRLDIDGALIAVFVPPQFPAANARFDDVVGSYPQSLVCRWRRALQGDDLLQLAVDIQQQLYNYTEGGPEREGEGGSPQGGSPDRREEGRDEEEEEDHSEASASVDERKSQQSQQNQRNIESPPSSVMCRMEELELLPIPIFAGAPFVEKKSIFQAFCAVVSNKKEACYCRDLLIQNPKIARATHNMFAFRVQVNLAASGGRGVSASASGGEGEGEVPLLPKKRFEKESRKKSSQLSAAVALAVAVAIDADEDSDGESGAGRKLLALLELLDVANVCVVVSRWYGGVKLGPARFRHICNAARELLVLKGFVDNRKR